MIILRNYFLWALWRHRSNKSLLASYPTMKLNNNNNKTLILFLFSFSCPDLTQLYSSSLLNSCGCCSQLRLNCEMLGLESLPGAFFKLPALSLDVLLSIIPSAVQKKKKNANRLKGSMKTSRRLRPNTPLAVAFCGAPNVTKTPRCREEKEHNTQNILGCCFLLIGLIHQRIYKACYLNAIFFYQNDNTIHKYSCTSSTDQSSSRVRGRTWRVSQTAEFHILVIILSVYRQK